MVLCPKLGNPITAIHNKVPALILMTTKYIAIMLIHSDTNGNSTNDLRMLLSIVHMYTTMCCFQVLPLKLQTIWQQHMLSSSFTRDQFQYVIVWLTKTVWVLQTTAKHFAVQFKRKEIIMLYEGVELYGIKWTVKIYRMARKFYRVKFYGSPLNRMDEKLVGF